MTTRRVLITGVSGPLGARLATRLAADPGVEHVVGIDTRRPPAPLADRITFVEADLTAGELAPILQVAAPHVVIHHDITQFPEPGRSRRHLHDLNVIGTLQVLAACSELPGLRQLVVRSAAAIYGSAPDAPAFFTEDLARSATLRTRFQRDIAELERLVAAFARRHPAVVCTTLRLQPVIGTTLDSPIMSLFRSPVVPTFLGFDPRLQLLLDEDALGAIVAAVNVPVRGPVNVAADGTVSLARMLRRLGKRALPIAAPVYAPTVRALARAGVVPPIDDDVVSYLRHGRGVDTTRMRAELRFVPTRTTVEAIDAVAARLRGEREGTAAA
ncbi:MAG TPA: NAD-dependent epimerase/dehydratase family protein [Baekduia sp.]|uniref:NAD-dependent epimerase/dehydratase family protein n=1 Tax=Baekduia sp. TaxID=2600305 RepID=UPI002D78EE74|nr:NAD-dependent epimerase/dehydratase family protein [Baekduia sp.]HET6508295.1 NAD-dependent epimerase/dehydratase family protein [Baekduia sp.]